MATHFFNQKKIEIEYEKIFNPLATPFKYLIYTILATYLVITCVPLPESLKEMPTYLLIANLIMFIFMLLFIIRPTGRKPFKIKNESIFILKNLFTFLSVIFISTLLVYTILVCHDKELFIFNPIMLQTSVHISIIWVFLPFFFNFVLSRFGIDIPYKFFLNMHTSTLKKTNLFSSTKQEIAHHKKDEIYIDIVQQTEIPDSKIAAKDYLKIQNMYLRLIKFWYAQKHYSFKLRSSFSILISIGSIIYFFYLLNFVHDIQENSNGTILGVQSMGIIAISLTILYFTMSYHINSFLNSEFYTSSILKELNKIYFDKHNHRQQLKLFLDKNFLIYIHDKHQDKHFCVNDSKDFQDFITNKKSDEEGRNLIIMVYISFFMILFIETSTGDLLGHDQNSSKKEILKNEK